MRTDPSRRRQQTYLAGHRAERFALIWLALRGYRILARRYQVHGGEIDLVVRRGATVAFVEVKARPTRDEALQVLTEAKRRRIERAAAVWLSRNPWASASVLRGDAVVIASRRLPLHIEAAFELRIG
ncbi:YraN family protein [Lichenifustis flavocetrariae]|uniref:UPF0102 protein M8523_16275 n=1 Tax=Lichenifustis flavocetrariae TaxID=2949735 RepID=A0AA41Z306_9HYPH|nr:YraN family protein [Lichenifustis flavocetrariae]MCW6509578.1 YraN family protein [Lichenifustis flavocetrariae]